MYVGVGRNVCRLRSVWRSACGVGRMYVGVGRNVYWGEECMGKCMWGGEECM